MLPKGAAGANLAAREPATSGLYTVIGGATVQTDPGTLNDDIIPRITQERDQSL
jgi:hypothetical protein